MAEYLVMSASQESGSTQEEDMEESEAGGVNAGAGIPSGPSPLGPLQTPHQQLPPPENTLPVQVEVQGLGPPTLTHHHYHHHKNHHQVGGGNGKGKGPNLNTGGRGLNSSGRGLKVAPLDPKCETNWERTKSLQDAERARLANGDSWKVKRLAFRNLPEFTVTRVDEEDGETSVGTVSDALCPEDGTASAPLTGSGHTAVRLPVPVDSGTSDAESSYGDTLTQTSITKLLSKKFKSYRTYKYDGNRKSLRRTDSTDTRKSGYRKRLISKYESQDYDQCENSLFLKEQETLKSVKIQRKWIARWLVNLMIGVGTAMVASIIEISIEFVAEYKFMALKYLVDLYPTGPLVVVPLVTWIIINASLVCIASLLVVFVEPQAAGSGIPQIKCYLNGVKIPGLLTLRALVAKAVGVILSVSGGLACGKEGPMIHSGAIVAAGVSQGRSRLCNLDFKIFEYLRSDTERRDFVSGGAAAGVSAAFGAPVGGVLFSLEEGASFWNQSLTWRIVFASMVATFTVNVLLSAFHGHPSDLSNPGLISFGQFSDITYQAIELPIFLLMGVIGGLSGALFNHINAKLTVFRKRYILAKWAKVAEAMIVASMSAVMGYVLIFTINECVTDSSKQGGHHTSPVSIHCPEGSYNMMSGIFFKTPEAGLITMLHDKTDAFNAWTLALFVVMYFLLACWTYGLQVSSGVFIPSLLTGAAWGRLVGLGVSHVFPLMAQNIGKYALIGAACQLGGTVRMTISLTVILIECTGDITFGLPIVMVLIIAKWVGDFFNSGLYDLHIQMMGIPLLPWEPPEMSYDITAKQVMNRPVVALRQTEKVRRILQVLLECQVHSGFPVVDDFDLSTVPLRERDITYGRCKGLILRSQLCLLLKYKVFGARGSREEISENNQLKLEDFRDAYREHYQMPDVNFTEEEKESEVDLSPYMNPTPYTLLQSTSLPRMFRLFRGLGLRHLIVVNEENQVVGMVTRKDLAKYRLKASGTSIEVQQLDIHHD